MIDYQQGEAAFAAKSMSFSSLSLSSMPQLPLTKPVRDPIFAALQEVLNKNEYQTEVFIFIF
jgi:hypothetical protein